MGNTSRVALVKRTIAILEKEMAELRGRAERAEKEAERYRVALEGAIRDLSLVGELRMPQSAQLSLRDRLRAALKREEGE